MNLHSPIRRDRRGAAIVEFALTVPVLLLLVVGAVEFSRANMLFHTAAAAASEGARRSIIAGSTAADVTQVVHQELACIGIRQAKIVIEPEIVTNDTKLVAVAIQVPVNSVNGYILPKFFIGKSVSKVAGMPREARNDPQMTAQLIDSMEEALEDLKSAPLQWIDAGADAPDGEGGEPAEEEPAADEPDDDEEGGGGLGDWLKKIFGW